MHTINQCKRVGTLHIFRLRTFYWAVSNSAHKTDRSSVNRHSGRAGLPVDSQMSDLALGFLSPRGSSDLSPHNRRTVVFARIVHLISSQKDIGSTFAHAGAIHPRRTVIGPISHAWIVHLISSYPRRTVGTPIARAAWISSYSLLSVPSKTTKIAIARTTEKIVPRRYRTNRLSLRLDLVLDSKIGFGCDVPSVLGDRRCDLLIVVIVLLAGSCLFGSVWE